MQLNALTNDNLMQHCVLTLLHLTTNSLYDCNDEDDNCHAHMWDDSSVIVNGWKNDYHFMTSKHECDWDVVICNNGHVSELYSGKLLYAYQLNFIYKLKYS